MELSVGHTPDADDAFMFYGMFTGKVTSPDFTVTHVIEDIENFIALLDPKIVTDHFGEKTSKEDLFKD